MAMHSANRVKACGWVAAACVALGWTPAFAGGQVVLGIGPPTPVFIPPPGSIPAPLPLPPQPNGVGIAPVQPLPPLVLYSSPTVVLPLAPRAPDHHHGNGR